MSPSHPVTRYRDFISNSGPAGRLRTMARDGAVWALSFAAPVAAGSEWIRFPFYHHVFDDERRGFASHLEFMAGMGDFVSIDEALAMLNSGDSLSGRYFCVTFDDGFKNNAVNALPILAEKNVPAAFFLAAGYIGTDPGRDRDKLLGFFDGGETLMEFMDWDDCRRLSEAGMTVGSHTMTHARLIDLDGDAVAVEMRSSKEVIEEKLGRPCRDFCCPWGRPGEDFLPARDPAMAAAQGYRSFLTTARGAMVPGADPMAIRRDHLLANWSNRQLRYFFARGLAP
jgi:hypothetical protein